MVTHSRSADILASLTRDVDRIEVVYAHTFAPVVAAYVVGPAALLVAGLLVGWEPISVAAVCLAVSLLVVPFFGTRAAMAATATTLARRRDLAHHISDSVFGTDAVIGYGLEAERLAAMDEIGREVAVSARRPRDFNGVRRGANVTMSALAALSVVWLGRGASPEVTPVVLAALAGGALRAFEGARGVEDAVGYLDHSLAAARRLWQIVHTPERVTDGPDELSLVRAPAVGFHGVSYAYPGGASRARGDAVSDVSWEVPAGAHAVLHGRSGSGKSTLVQLLARYDDPRAGRITLDGEPLTRFSLDSLRRNVVVVSQRAQLLDCSLADNLRLGAPEATEEETWEVLRIVGLAAEVASMPEGLRTPVGPNGSALSGGQVQRVCLARALLMRPRVLILDEFTSNLNAGLESEIRSALAAWPEEMTVIEVSHRPDAASHADVVALIDAGRLVATEPVRSQVSA